MSTATTAPTAVAYTIDPAHSGAGFKIRHLMVAYIRGGFGGVTGDVILDPTNPANTKIKASINATTLHTQDEKRDAHVKGAALRRAEITEGDRVKKRYGKDLPYYWGAFVLVGR